MSKDEYKDWNVRIRIKPEVEQAVREIARQEDRSVTRMIGLLLAKATMESSCP
jgi:hypothetical protein